MERWANRVRIGSPPSRVQNLLLTLHTTRLERGPGAVAKPPELVSLRCLLPRCGQVAFPSCFMDWGPGGCILEGVWPMGSALTGIIFVSEHSFAYLLVGLF